MIETGQLFLVVLATVMLGISASAIANRIRYRAEGIGRVLPKIVAAVVAINLVFLITRVQQLGLHRTMQSAFDGTILLATLLTTAALFSQRNRAVLGLEGFLLPTAGIIQLGSFAMVFNEPPDPQLAGWLVMHQISLILAAAFFISGGLAGAVYLVLIRTLRRSVNSPLLGRFAPLDSWERIGRWCTLLGFGLFTFGILTGLCKDAHLGPERRADWLTDKVIMLCFGLWLVYGLALVATWVVPSFRGRRAALLAVGSGVVLIAVFLAIDFLSVVHQ
ncbi:MAG: cytochrome c biogenesis protein CcsA [bacterium]|nr:cytochrome c biogenesis protein CcsA [bacterium]